MAMYPLEPGDRDRIITIQQLTESIGATGFPIETWSTLVESMPAARQDFRGYERFRAVGEQAAYDVIFRINYRADMDPELVDIPKSRRILAQGRTYDIVSAHMLGVKDGVELLAVGSGRTS